MNSALTISLAVIVALIGFGGSVLVAKTSMSATRESQKAENKRKRADFQHEINLKRAERLRGLYEPFVALQISLDRAVQARGYNEWSDPVPMAIQAEIAELQTRGNVAQEVEARLALDPDAAEVKPLIEDVVRTYNAFVFWFRSDWPRDLRDHKEIQKDREAFQEATKTAVQAMQEQLRGLEIAVAP